MPSISRGLVRLITVCLCAVLLAACGNREGSGQDTVGPSRESSADTQKYNAYIEASNRYMQTVTRDPFVQPTFAWQHARLSKVVDGTYDFQQSAFGWDAKAAMRLRTDLESALALPGKHPVLDAAAKPLLDVLKKMDPFNQELTYYGETSGSLADGGAKAQAIAPQLLPLLEQADSAMEVFDEALEQADEALMRTTMEQAKDGTLEKYHITSVYHARRIYSALHALHAEIMERRDIPPQLLEHIQQDLQAFDSNAQAYFAYLADHKLEGNCNIHKGNITHFLSDSRSLLHDLQQKSWGYWNSMNGHAITWDHLVKREFESIIRHYNGNFLPGSGC